MHELWHPTAVSCVSGIQQPYVLTAVNLAIDSRYIKACYLAQTLCAVHAKARDMMLHH